MRGRKNMLKKLLQLMEENNKMLKQVISYINYKELCKNSDDFDDFIRNVLANVISNPKNK